MNKIITFWEVAIACNILFQAELIQMANKGSIAVCVAFYSRISRLSSFN